MKKEGRNPGRNDSPIRFRHDDSMEPRAEAVERARRLLADPSYPDLATARALSSSLLNFLDAR